MRCSHVREHPLSSEERLNVARHVGRRRPSSLPTARCLSRSKYLFGCHLLTRANPTRFPLIGLDTCLSGLLLRCLELLLNSVPPTLVQTAVDAMMADDGELTVVSLSGRDIIKRSRM